MRQTKMGFAMDAGEVAERRNLLGLAILRLRAIEERKVNLQCRELLLWVFNATASGMGGELKKSYRELAGWPWGLCCSIEAARDAVRILRHHRLLRVDENRFQSFGQSANGYSIDWCGVYSLLGLRGGPAVPGEQGAVPGEQGAVPGEQPFKEETPLSDPLLFNSGPEAGPGRGEEMQVRAEPAATATADGADVDWLRAEFIATIPELTAAAAVSVPPAPPGDCLYGVYAGLTLSHVHKPLMMAGWIRQQLGAKAPVMEGTEADVLLAMAAAMHAAAVEFGGEKKANNRVAVLVTVISRRLWRKAAPYVRKAGELLAAAKRYRQENEVQT